MTQVSQMTPSPNLKHPFQHLHCLLCLCLFLLHGASCTPPSGSGSGSASTSITSSATMSPCCPFCNCSNFLCLALSHLLCFLNLLVIVKNALLQNSEPWCRLFKYIFHLTLLSCQNIVRTRLLRLNPDMRLWLQLMCCAHLQCKVPQFQDPWAETRMWVENKERQNSEEKLIWFSNCRIHTRQLRLNTKGETAKST